MITAVGLILGASGAALIWSAIQNVSLVDEVRAAFDGEERAPSGDDVPVPGDADYGIARNYNDDLDLPPKESDPPVGGGGSFGGGGSSSSW